MYGNNNSRGCQFLQEDVSTKGLRWGESVSLVGAGFLGAGLTAVVIGILATVGVVLGILRVGRKDPIRGTSSNTSSRGSVVRAYKRRVLTHVVDPPLFDRIAPKRCKFDDTHLSL